MNIITATDKDSIEIAPRYFASPVVAYIENEATNVSFTYSVAMGTASNYSTLDITDFSFVDGNYYLLKVTDNETEIFRGRIYYVTEINTPFERAEPDYVQSTKKTKYTIYE